jgi:hypothetical protein
VFLSDGCPYCHGEVNVPRAIAQIAGANYKRHPINSIVVGTDICEDFPRKLVEMNGGTYRRILR